MTHDEYRALAGVNFSTLKYMAESCLHYRDAVETARTVTAAMNVGTAGHCMVLEPEAFPPRYVTWTGGRRAGKEWEGFKASNPDKTIITAEEYDRCVAMRDAVMAHPRARELLTGGEAEKVITWTDDETGLLCKARLDYLSWALTDLKTTATAHPRRFGAVAGRQRYYAQLAFYQWGVELALHRGVPCYVLAVENERPHDVVPYRVNDVDLAAGLEQCREWLRKVAECRESGRWPGRCETETDLFVPPWAFEAEDEGSLGITINGTEA